MSIRLILAPALLAALGAPLYAQTMAESGFALDRFDPADRGSEWFVVDSVSWSGELKPSVGLIADFASKPLVVYDERDVEKMTIVDRQLVTHVGGSLVVRDRFRFGLALPVVLSQSGAIGMNGGATFPPPESTAVG